RELAHGGAHSRITLTARADAALRDRHPWAARRCADGRAGRLLLTTPLRPDEARHRQDEHDDRDPGVQAQAGEVVGRVDPEQLLEEAAERVVGDVEAEDPRRPDAEPAPDPDEQEDSDRVPAELVEEGRVEGRVLLVAGRTVVAVDLETPGEARRLPEELLV